MTIEHYIVFIGAGASLATELSSIERRLASSRVVAPAAKRKYMGNTQVAVKEASKVLHEVLAGDERPSEKARLYVWMYEPSNVEELNFVWNAFGHASWVETVPKGYLHKVIPTREYVHDRIRAIRVLLHEISIASYGRRKTSPLILPLRNFSSGITKELKTYWYNQLDQDGLQRSIRRLKSRYVQTKSRQKNGYRDEKSLIFKPAVDNECHGKPHPIGSKEKAFVCGRFRYGVSIFPGFHFDVSAENGSTIQCNLRTSAGEIRRMRGERRQHVNIFPNDHILPER